MSAGRPPAREWFDLIVQTASVKGLSIADVAGRACVARTTVYGWRDNPGKPQAKSVNAVADALGIPRERALRLAGIISAVPAEPEDDDALRPEERERLEEHIREVLGDKAGAMLEALDKALADKPPTGGGSRKGAPSSSGRSGSFRAGGGRTS